MSQTRRTERLINLLFVLMSATRPVPKVTIRQALDDYASSPSDEAFERMFERDKEELRSMGVPIDTVEGSVGPGGIDGYRVRGDRYALPDVSFTPEELAVLSLAAQVWEQASLGPAARSAVRKLEASGGSARHDGVGVVARLSTPEESFPAFFAASQARRPVTFGYRKPGDEQPTERHLEPWGLVSRQGHWYVAGQDRDRGAPRVFRLSRVAGEVRDDGPDGSYETPASGTAQEMLEAVVRQQSDAPRQRAQLRVASGRAASLRRAAASLTPEPDGAADRLDIDYVDDESFAEQLVAHGSAVTVLAPPTLRAAVMRRLSAALSAAEAV